MWQPTTESHDGQVISSRMLIKMSREHWKLCRRIARIQKGILHLMYYNVTLHYVQKLRYRYLCQTQPSQQCHNTFSIHFPLDWDHNCSVSSHPEGTHLSHKCIWSGDILLTWSGMKTVNVQNKQTNKHAKPSTTGILNHEHHCVKKTLNVQHSTREFHWRRHSHETKPVQWYTCT